MAIITGFVRHDLRHDVDGCPLNDGGDEAACATCPYNALDPGKARVGCAVHSPSAEVKSALARLAQIDARAAARLEQILDDQRRRREDEGLPGDDLNDLAALADKWARVVSGDAGEQHVVALLQRFTAAAKRTGEALRVLS